MTGSHCASCGRRMRPRGSDPLLYPGTMARAFKGMCSACYQRSVKALQEVNRRRSRAVSHPPLPLSADEVRVDGMVPRFNRLLKDRAMVRAVLGLDRCDS